MDRRGIITAVSPEWVIGVGNKIPWHHPADLKRFKRLTMGATLIMGRLTWESQGSKPLPGRRNIVITRGKVEGADCFADIPSALETCTGPVWFIGGAGIYREAFDYADFIDVTYVPDHVTAENAVKFPKIDATLWEGGPLETDPDDPTLKHQVFQRRPPN